MSSPLVVAALQAPTLLNIWARSPAWRLEVAELGDHQGLEESTMLRVPRYETGEPLAVLVCAPSHVDSARERWPRAKLAWIAHNARLELFPDWCREACDASVALARSIASRHDEVTLEISGRRPASVIVPAYEPEPRFRWRRETLWTMMSRPETRHEDHVWLLAEVQRRLRGGLAVYGQGQLGGFLAANDREHLIAGSSAYVTPLPEWSGFGLAEHEMLAAGVPVVGPVWADLGEEMFADYVTLGGGPDAWAVGAKLLAEHEECAVAVGSLGPAFVAQHRTERRMNLGVEEFLDKL